MFALKVFKREYIERLGEQALGSIEKEMQIMSNLDHPNIVELLACGDNGRLQESTTGEVRENQIYIAMEYFEGQDLFDF